MCTASTRGTSSSTGWSPVRAPPECPHACTRPPACPVDPFIIVDGTVIHPQTHHMTPPSNRHPRLPRARHGSARRRRGHSAHHSAARSARHRGARHGARGAYAPWLARACVCVMMVEVGGASSSLCARICVQPRPQTAGGAARNDLRGGREPLRARPPPPQRTSFLCLSSVSTSRPLSTSHRVFVTMPI